MIGYLCLAEVYQEKMRMVQERRQEKTQVTEGERDIARASKRRETI